MDIFWQSRYTYAIGITLGRMYEAYAGNNFGNPKIMTDTSRQMKPKLAKAVSS